MLERLWKGLAAKPEASEAAPRIVMSLPPTIREGLGPEGPPLRTTYEAFSELFRSARSSLKIFAPYVDPTFTGLMAGVAAEVQVVTTICTGRGGKLNAVLERCASAAAGGRVFVRYLNEQRKQTLMYQMHAKLVLADGARAYVGSANLTDTSIHYNLELGLLVDDPGMTRSLERIFDHLFKNVAVPSKLL